MNLLDTIAQTFLLYPFAPYYVIYLAARDLSAAVEAQKTRVEEARRLLFACDRRVLAPQDTSTLTGMRTALQALSQALAQGSSAQQNISTFPAYQRYFRQSARFLQGPAQALPQGGDIAPTPQEAKEALSAMLPEIFQAQESLRTAATTLIHAYDTYVGLGLLRKASGSILSKAEQTVQGHEQDWASKTPVARLGVLRQTTLDILATRGALQQLAQLPAAGDPTSLLYHRMEGSVTPYADSVHPAVPATVQSDAGPFVILPGSQTLTCVTESGTDTITLRPAYLPEQISTILEPYTIEAGACPFVVETTRNGVTTTTSIDLNTLLGDGTFSADEVVAAVNPTLQASAGMTLESTIGLPKLASVTVELIPVSESGGFWTLEMVCFGTDFSALSVVIGDLVLFQTANSPGLEDLEHTAWTVTAVLTAPDQNKLHIQRQMASVALPASPHNLVFRIGVRRQLKLKALDTAQAIADLLRFSTRATDNPGALALGLSLGLPYETRLVPPANVVEDINGQADYVDASTVFQASLEVSATTVTTQPQRLQISRMPRVSAALTLVDGTHFELVSAQTDWVAAGVVVGDVVVLRSGDLIDTSYVITFVSATALRALGQPTPLPVVLVDVGPDLSQQVQPGHTVSIATGTNAGLYTVQKVADTTPLDLTLLTTLPLYRSGLRSVTLSVSLGATEVKLQSRGTLLTSSLQITGSAASALSAAWPQAAATKGQTTWLRIGQASWPRALEGGDLWEEYTQTYAAPSFTSVIDMLDKTYRLIKVRDPRPVDVSWSVAMNVPPPYARIRLNRQVAYAAMKTRLESWLLRPENKNASVAVKNITAKIKAVLLQENPTTFQVAEARQALESLYTGLTPDSATELAQAPEESLGYALSRYQIKPVRQVDAALQALNDLGADRAVDLLRKALFEEFFALTPAYASYAGAVQAAIREVERNDLPVRAVKRNHVNERVIATVASPDYEYDQSDIAPSKVATFPYTGQASEVPDFFGSKPF
jgi:hypothetical protein